MITMKRTPSGVAGTSRDLRKRCACKVKNSVRPRTVQCSMIEMEDNLGTTLLRQCPLLMIEFQGKHRLLLL